VSVGYPVTVRPRSRGRRIVGQTALSPATVGPRRIRSYAYRGDFTLSPPQARAACFITAAVQGVPAARAATGRTNVDNEFVGKYDNNPPLFVFIGRSDGGGH